MTNAQLRREASSFVATIQGWINRFVDITDPLTETDISVFSQTLGEVQAVADTTPDNDEVASPSIEGLVTDDEVYLNQYIINRGIDLTPYKRSESAVKDLLAQVGGGTGGGPFDWITSAINSAKVFLSGFSKVLAAVLLLFGIFVGIVVIHWVFGFGREIVNA
jgi:hypothetical protein